MRKMTNNLIAYLCVFSLCLGSFSAFAQQVMPHQAHEHVVFIEFDANQMDKYKYQVEQSFIIDEDHTSFHIPISSDKTLILLVLVHDTHYDLEKPWNVPILTMNQASTLNKNFALGINGGTSHVYMMEKKGYGYQAFHVTTALIETVTAKDISYESPDYSFYIDRSKNYNPAEELYLPSGADEYYCHSRYFYHGESKEQHLDKFSLLRVTKQVCSNRSFGVVTPRTSQGQTNPYIGTTVTGSRMGSCQHPIITEYVDGIGLYKESYEDDRGTHTTRLVSVNDMPIDQYIAQKNPYEGTAMSYSRRPQTQSMVKGVEKTAIRKPVLRSTYVNEPVRQYNIPTYAKTPVRTYNMPKSVKVTNQAAVKKSYAKAHVVQKGDTLYSLAKRYGSTVEKLKEINGLTSSTIEINQELMY